MLRTLCLLRLDLPLLSVFYHFLLGYIYVFILCTLVRFGLDSLASIGLPAASTVDRALLERALTSLLVPSAWAACSRKQPVGKNRKSSPA